MRLRNIGWLVCAGTSLTALPVSLRFSSVASPPPLPRPRRFPHALSTHRLPPSLSFTPALSLSRSVSPLYHLRFHLSPPFSPLSTLNPLSRSPSPPIAWPPATRTRESRGARYTHVHTCSRTYGSKVFARGGQYSPTTRTTPSRPRGRQGEEGADGRGDTILPSCRGRDIFSLSRDNLETGVALPARESSEGARDSAPGKTLLSSLAPFHSFLPSARPLPLSSSPFLFLSVTTVFC